MQKQAAKSAKDAGKNKGIFFIESCKLDSKQKTMEDRWGGRGSLMKNMTNIAGLSCILLHIAGKITGICHKRLILIRIGRPKSEEIRLQYQLTTSNYCLHSSALCHGIVVFSITVELNAVTEDNKVLKQRIQILESELKK